MSFIGSIKQVFASEKKTDLDAMTPEQRVEWFAKQNHQLEKDKKQMVSFFNKVIGIAEVLVPDRFQKYINIAMPYIRASMTNPESIVDHLNEGIDVLAGITGVPAHHMSITFAKPKGIRNFDGTITPNKDINAVIRVYNPHFKDFFVIEWNLRSFFRGLNDDKVKFSLKEEIKEVYERKPEQNKLQE